MLVTKACSLLTIALLLRQPSPMLRPASWALISLLGWGCHVFPCGLTQKRRQEAVVRVSGLKAQRNGWLLAWTPVLGSHRVFIPTVTHWFTQGVHTNSEPCLLPALLFLDWHSRVALLGSYHSSLSASSGLYDSGPEVYLLAFFVSARV